MRLLRTAVLTVAGGLLMAVFLFAVTTPSSEGLSMHGIGQSVDGHSLDWEVGSVDPWTGTVRPLTKVYTDDVTGVRDTTEIWPDGYANVRVIPLPIGFIVGCLVTLALIATARRPGNSTTGRAASTA